MDTPPYFQLLSSLLDPLPLCVLCASVVLLAAFFIWRRWFQTYHLATVDPGKFFRDGNRGLREYQTMLRRVKPRTVVSLIDDQEAVDRTKPEFAHEEAFLKTQPAVAFERIAVQLGGWPDDAAIARFLSIATDAIRQPVVVHCAQGVRRTGMMVAAYQLNMLGWSKEQAKAEVLTFGHSQRTVRDVQRFIDVYDPATRRMTESLEQSKE